MGEAKRRKETDPTYGKVPKDHGRRGIVLSNPIEILEKGVHAKSSNIDRQELRFSLLFWDELVWPSSNFIHFASNADEAFLESEGVLKRPQVRIPGGSAGDVVSSAFLQAFLDLEQKEPGAWAMSSGPNSISWDNNPTFRQANRNMFEASGGALLELTRAVPIPTGDVPLAEILEFKALRRPELLSFRHHVERMAAELENAENKQDELQRQINIVGTACADLTKVGREWQFPVAQGDFIFSVNLNLLTSISAGYGAYEAASKLPIIADLAPLAGLAVGAISTLNIKTDRKFRSIRRPASPYRYAYLIHQELPSIGPS